MQSVSVAVPPLSLIRPPPTGASLPVSVQPVSVTVPTCSTRTPPPLPVAVLPTIATLDSVTVPPSTRARRRGRRSPPRIVTPESVASASLNSKTRLALLPEIVSRSGPGPEIVVDAVSFSVSGPSASVIVCGVANAAGSKLIVRAASRVLASRIAWRRLSWPGRRRRRRSSR